MRGRPPATGRGVGSQRRELLEGSIGPRQEQVQFGAVQPDPHQPLGIQPVALGHGDGLVERVDGGDVGRQPGGPSGDQLQGVDGGGAGIGVEQMVGEIVEVTVVGEPADRVGDVGV